MSRRASGTVNSGDIATTAEIARSAVEKYRLEGNAAYAKAKYKDAISAYGQAIQAYWQLARGDEVEARKDRERMVEVLGAGTPSVSALVESSSSFLSSAFASAVSSLTGAPAPPADASSIASSSQQLSSTVEVADLRPAVLYSNRSAALVHLRRYKLAQEDASFAMRLEPDWPKGYFRTAEALIGERRYDEALAYLHRSLERHGDEEVQAKIVLQRRIQHTASLLHDKNSGLRIMQLLAGRDFATSSWSPINKLIFQFATSMQNYVYCIACERTRKCVLVDACWDVDGIVEVVQKEGLQIVGTIVTHYHFDHVGGTPPPPYDSYRIKVDGVAKLLRKFPDIKAYIHSEDIAEVLKANDMSMDQIEPTHEGMRLKVGESVDMRFIHTPGHTPGSQCLLVNGCRLFSGDTVFIGSVGRLDFPDSDPQRMFHSLQKIKALASTISKAATNEDKGTDASTTLPLTGNDEDIIIYTGHDYGGAFTSLRRELAENRMLLAADFNAFIRAFNDQSSPC